MLSEEKLKMLPPKAQAYWRRAQEFVTKNQTEWCVIKPGMEEWTEWTKYFARQGWKPFGIRQVEQGRCETFLVPTKWPEWFDAPAIGTASTRTLAFQDS